MIDSIDTTPASTQEKHPDVGAKGSSSKRLDDLLDDLEAALKTNAPLTTVQSIENTFISQYMEEYKSNGQDFNQLSQQARTVLRNKQDQVR